MMKQRFAIDAGSPPFFGSFRPDSPLSALDGENTLGFWGLIVRDHVPADTGIIRVWELVIDRVDAVPVPGSEPTSLALFGMGLAALLARRRRA